MSNTEIQDTLTLTEASDLLIEALANDTAFAAVGMQDEDLDPLSEIADISTVTINQSIFDEAGHVPFYAIKQAHAANGRVGVAYLYDNQDIEFGVETPSSLLFSLSTEQIAALKHSLKSTFSLVLGISTAEQAHAFIERLKLATKDGSFTNQMTFDLLSVDFSLPHTDENNCLLDNIDWRYSCKAQVRIPTTRYQLQAADAFKAIIGFMVVARDFDCKSYIEMTVPFVDLVRVINE